MFFEMNVKQTTFKSCDYSQLIFHSLEVTKYGMLASKEGMVIQCHPHNEAPKKETYYTIRLLGATALHHPVL